jgi:hypothetical protein
MKSFNYTARDKTGGMKSGSLQAADRNSALQELTAKGLVPLSVIEGVARTTGYTFNPLYVLYLALALVVIGFAVKFFFLDTFHKATSEKKPKIATKSTVKEPKNNNKKNNVPDNPATNATMTVSPLNASFTNLENKVSEKKERRVLRPYLDQTNRVIRFGGNKTNAPTGFTSRIDFAINQLASTQMGMPPPPLIFIPPGEDVKAALERSILVYDTDTEETIEKKAAIAQSKQAMKDYIAQGGNPNEFSNFYHKQLLNAYEERRASQKNAMDLLKAGDKDGAALYVEEQNKKFAEKGYVPISIPAIFQK